MMQHILNCIGSTVITVLWGKDSGGMSNNQQKPQVGVIPKGKGHREEVKGAFKERESVCGKQIWSCSTFSYLFCGTEFEVCRQGKAVSSKALRHIVLIEPRHLTWTRSSLPLFSPVIVPHAGREARFRAQVTLPHLHQIRGKTGGGRSMISDLVCVCVCEGNSKTRLCSANHLKPAIKLLLFFF